HFLTVHDAEIREGAGGTERVIVAASRLGIARGELTVRSTRRAGARIHVVEPGDPDPVDGRAHRDVGRAVAADLVHEVVAALADVDGARGSPRPGARRG